MRHNPLLEESNKKRMERYLELLKQGNTSEAVEQLYKVVSSEHQELSKAVHLTKLSEGDENE